MSAGHHQQAALFEAMRTRERMPHAFLFTGPQGVGKRAFAHAVAQWLQQEGTPSLQLGVAEVSHPDIVTVQAPSIEEVRSLRSVVARPPYEAPVRSIIIDRTEELGEEATNALLKTLEEPRSRTFFFLLSAYPSRVMPTIASRCQRVHFGLLGQEAPANSALAGRPYREAAVWDASLRDAATFVGASIAERFAIIERYHEEGASLPTLLESLMVYLQREVGLARSARALAALLDMSRRIASTNANTSWMMRSFAVRLPSLLS